MVSFLCFSWCTTSSWWSGSVSVFVFCFVCCFSALFAVGFSASSCVLLSFQVLSLRIEALLLLLLRLLLAVAGRSWSGTFAAPRGARSNVSLSFCRSSFPRFASTSGFKVHAGSCSSARTTRGGGGAGGQSKGEDAGCLWGVGLRRPGRRRGDARRGLFRDGRREPDLAQ